MIYECKQGSLEWFALREYRLTASHAQAISANGKGLITYVDSKILELIVGKKEFINKDIDRGNELEPIARIDYEFKHNCTVREVGFISYDKYETRIGVSPDGLINDDGGAEFKARNDEIHLRLLKDGKFDSKTIWQCQQNLLVTGRKWWDAVSFNPHFTQSSFTKRIYPDKEKFAKLELGFIAGIKMFNDLLANETIKKEIENGYKNNQK